MVRYNGIPGSGRMQIYAHRAGKGLMPEQTLPAYVAALRLGVDYVDMDIGMTKDSVLIITHDLTLNPDLTRDQNGRWITRPDILRGILVTRGLNLPNGFEIPGDLLRTHSKDN